MVTTVFLPKILTEKITKILKNIYRSVYSSQYDKANDPYLIYNVLVTALQGGRGKT